jgi:hypothetical protein
MKEIQDHHIRLEIRIMQHMLRLVILIFLTTPIIWDYKVMGQKSMLQINKGLFSIYPTDIVGDYGLKALFSKEFCFLKHIDFFAFLRLAGC